MACWSGWKSKALRKSCQQGGPTADSDVIDYIIAPTTYEPRVALIAPDLKNARLDQCLSGMSVEQDTRMPVVSFVSWAEDQGETRV